MKYILMLNAPRGTGDWDIFKWTPEEINAHMVALNHAIATAMVHGPHAGLELLSSLDTDPRIARHYRLDAVRAHLWQMAGDDSRAMAHYRSAAARTESLPERDYLINEAARLRQTSPRGPE